MSLRFTLTDDDHLFAHGPMGERDLLPDEIEKVRNALSSKPLPWWLEYGSVAVGIVALAVLARGGGQ